MSLVTTEAQTRSGASIVAGGFAQRSGAKVTSLTEPGKVVALRAVMRPYLTLALSLPLRGPERESVLRVEGEPEALREFATASEARLRPTI